MNVKANSDCFPGARPGRNRSARRLLPFIASLLILSLWPADMLLSRPAVDMLPLVYPWGDSYTNITHELASLGVPLIQEVEGDYLRLRRANLEVHYRFYTKEKIGDIILGEREEEGRKRAILERLVLVPAEPREMAPLYAVDVRLPGLPLEDDAEDDATDGLQNADGGQQPDGSGNADDNQMITANESRSLLARLESLYGRSARRSPRDRLSPAQSEETRRAREKEQGATGRRTAGSLEFGNRDTLVRVDYRVQGGRRYASRMSFVSREISRVRNRDIEKLKKLADRQIRRKIRVADRELRREARRRR